MIDADVTIGHSGNLSPDGKVIVFGHEPGAGVQPRCTATRTVLPGPCPITGRLTNQSILAAAEAGKPGYVLVAGKYQAGSPVVDFSHPAEREGRSRRSTSPVERTRRRWFRTSRTTAGSSTSGARARCARTSTSSRSRSRTLRARSYSGRSRPRAPVPRHRCHPGQGDEARLCRRRQPRPAPARSPEPADSGDVLQTQALAALSGIGKTAGAAAARRPLPAFGVRSGTKQCILSRVRQLRGRGRRRACAWSGRDGDLSEACALTVGQRRRWQ